MLMGRKAIDLSGQNFGRLTVLDRAENKGAAVSWNCICSCGAPVVVTGKSLKSGSTKSCGCFRAEVREQLHEHNKNQEPHDHPNFKHGGTAGSESVEYIAWMNMKKTFDFVPEWLEFQNFFKAIGWRPSAEHCLSRHDIREPHGPNNTYWKSPNEIKDRRNLGLPRELAPSISNILAQSRAAETASA